MNRGHVWQPAGAAVQFCAYCPVVRRWRKPPGAEAPNWYYYRSPQARRSLTISDPRTGRWPHDYCHGRSLSENHQPDETTTP